MAAEKKGIALDIARKKGANIEDAKKKALNEAITQIEKQFGKGAIMKLGESSADKNIDVISTGCLPIDIALGINGVPRGRIVEIYGPESSGKTTLTLHIIAEAQKQGGTAAFIDAEHALDPVYAKALGVNLDELFVSQPDSGEQALEISEALVRSGAIDLVVIDSVAALTPKAEIDGLMGDSHVGVLARLMSQALRKLASVISKSNTCVIFINQLRDKIGGGMYGGPSETTTGGKALKFYASVRIDIRRCEQIKDSTAVYGNRTKAKIVKNKLAPPFKIAEFDIMYGKGISKEGSVIDIASEMDIIIKSGSWFSYEGNKLGQGKENVKIYLEEHPELTEELTAKIFAKIAEQKKANSKQGKSDNDAKDADLDKDTDSDKDDVPIDELIDDFE